MKNVRVNLFFSAIASLLISDAAAKGCAYEAIPEVVRFSGWTSYAHPLVPTYILPGEYIRVVVSSNMASCPTAVLKVWRDGVLILSTYPTGQDTVLCTIAGNYFIEIAVPPGVYSDFELPASFTLAYGSQLTFSAAALLDGPYNSNNGLMRDDQRSLGLTPSYFYGSRGGGVVEGSTNAAPALLAITGNNAVVDWGQIDLRAASNPSEVLVTIPVLFQRDGDLLNALGSGLLSCTAPPGNYVMTIRHRIHLSATIQTPVLLGGAPPFVDFRDPGVAMYGTNATRIVNNVRTLWAGDGLHAYLLQSVKYVGPFNERDQILIRLGGTTPTNVRVCTYVENEDLNMDGYIKYTGAKNDRDVILQTLGGNVTGVRTEQLPVVSQFGFRASP